MKLPLQTGTCSFHCENISATLRYRNIKKAVILYLQFVKTLLYITSVFSLQESNVLGDSYQVGTSEIPQLGLSSAKFEKKVSQMRISII
jgi:hypothetical protein